MIEEKSDAVSCKEQYCIGTWNVRSMNQGKLEVVKQEMARVNVNILGIMPERRSSSSAPRRDSAEPRPRGCSGLGVPRPALPSV